MFNNVVINKEEMLTTLYFAIAFVVGGAIGIIGGLVIFG